MQSEAKVVVDIDQTVDYGNVADASRFMLEEASDAGDGYETGDSYDAQFFEDTDPDENEDFESLGSEDSDPEVTAAQEDRRGATMPHETTSSFRSSL